MSDELGLPGRKYTSPQSGCRAKHERLWSPGPQSPGSPELGDFL